MDRYIFIKQFVIKAFQWHFKSKAEIKSANSNMHSFSFPLPSLTLKTLERDRQLTNHTEAISSLKLTQFDKASCQKVINMNRLWNSYVSLQSLNHIHFLILERWEISSGSPIFHLLPQHQTVGISGCVGLVTGRGCNCQNRKTQKAQNQERSWGWPNSCYHGTDATEQKSLQVLCGSLMHNHCHLRGEMYFKIYLMWCTNLKLLIVWLYSLHGICRCSGFPLHLSFCMNWVLNTFKIICKVPHVLH